MKILITGGAGFIGSHLAEYLIHLGHHVTVLDNLSTGHRSNIEGLLRQERFNFIKGCVLDERLVDRLTAEADQVYHLAAAVGVRRILSQPVDSLLTNVRGTENVLHAAWEHRCKILVASTSEVYGKQSGRRLKETDDRVYGATTVTRWGYACSKALDEFLALAYYRERGLQTVIVRFFNIIGPRQTGDYGMVVPTFIRQALRGEPITVYGSGQQTRSFTYVGDAVRAIVRLMEEPRALGEIINIGSGDVISISSLAHRVKDLAGSSSPIVHLSYSEAYGPGFEDMQERTPDIAKLRQTITYKPEKSLDEILSDIIAFERDRVGV